MLRIGLEAGIFAPAVMELLDEIDEEEWELSPADFGLEDTPAGSSGASQRSVDDPVEGRGSSGPAFQRVWRCVHCAPPDVLIAVSGHDLANRFRAVVDAADADLAERLAMDDEDEGLAVAAADPVDLRAALAIVVGAGFLRPDLLDGLRDVDLVDYVVDEPPDDVPEPRATAPAVDLGATTRSVLAPMVPHAVTETGVVGAFDVASFAPDTRPGTTPEALRAHAVEALKDDEWAWSLGVRVEEDLALVAIEAPDIATLERAASKIGIPGPHPSSYGRFEWLTMLRDDPPPASPADWSVNRVPGDDEQWLAHGSSDGVTIGPFMGTYDQALDTIGRHLTTTDEAIARRVTLSFDVVANLNVSAADRSDVEWALQVLGLPAH